MKVPNRSQLWLVAVVATLLIVALAIALLSRESSDASDDNASGSRSATGNNVFAISLYQQLARSPGNAVMSPLSIRTALATALAGARGQTAQEIVQALRLPDGERASMRIAAH